MFGGVVSPAPRVVGPSSVKIVGVDVPAGVRIIPSVLLWASHLPFVQTIVSISSPFLHENPDIFSDPLTFNPDRWLQPNSRELENYLVPFSRGPRSCLGIKYSPSYFPIPWLFTCGLHLYSLAWCELFITFANIFRHLDMEIFQTRCLRHDTFYTKITAHSSTIHLAPQISSTEHIFYLFLPEITCMCK